MASRQAERSNVISLNFPTNTIKSPGAGPPVAGLVGDVVPKGFPLLSLPRVSTETPILQDSLVTFSGSSGGIVPKGFPLLAPPWASKGAPILQNASAAVPVLQGIVDPKVNAKISPVVPEALLTAEVLATPLTQSADFNQPSQTVAIQPFVIGLFLQRPVLAAGRIEVVPVQQPGEPASRPSASVAQLVPEGKSVIETAVSAPVVLSTDQKAVFQRIALGPNPMVTVTAAQVQPTSAAPTQIIQVTGEPSRLPLPTPENTNLAPPQVVDTKVMGQQPTTVKAPIKSNTDGPVMDVKSVVPAGIRTQDTPQADLRPNPASTAAISTPISPTISGPAMTLQEVVKPIASAVQTQSLPPVANVDTKRPSYQEFTLTAEAVSRVATPSGTAVKIPVTDRLTQDHLPVERPVTIVDIFSKIGAMAELEKPVSGVSNSANSISEPLNVPDRAQPEVVSVLAPSPKIEAANALAASQEANVKAAPKPFAEALMAQVKSVEASQGRTTVNLIPRGLGNIEIEVVTAKDVTSKVVVRVENPAVLQALRDDRQLLAQAIGVTDSSIFDFQEHGARDQSESQHNHDGQSGDPFGEPTAPQSQRQNLDVVHEGQLDIMT